MVRLNQPQRIAFSLGIDFICGLAIAGIFVVIALSLSGCESIIEIAAR